LAKRLHPANYFMPGDDRMGNARQFTIHVMQIGPADAAGTDLDRHGTKSRNRILPLLKLKRRLQDHHVHRIGHSYTRTGSVSGVRRPEFDPPQTPQREAR